MTSVTSVDETMKGIAGEMTSETGQVLVEYSLILGLIVVVAVTLLSAVGDKVDAMLALISGAF